MGPLKPRGRLNESNARALRAADVSFPSREGFGLWALVFPSPVVEVVPQSALPAQDERLSKARIHYGGLVTAFLARHWRRVFA